MIWSLDQEFESTQDSPTASGVKRHLPSKALTRTQVEGVAAGRKQACPVNLIGQLPGRRIFVRDGAAGIEESNGWPVTIRRMN